MIFSPTLGLSRINTRDKVNSILEILNLSSEHLKRKYVAEPRLSSELIIAHALNIKRLDIYLQFDRMLNNEELAQIRIFLRRRADHEPLQYIFGETEFYGLKFKVDNSVLIPRSDTETLVEKAASVIGNRAIDILEIGTGSGCIAVSLAYVCRKAKITATDVSDKVLNIAHNNAKDNKVSDRIKFIKHDILNETFPAKYDIIISNPPYINKEAVDTLDRQVRDFEPMGALTDNDDGRTFYKRINNLIPEILDTNGSVILEIGYDQAETVREIFMKSFKSAEVIKDLSGNDRVLYFSLGK